MSTTIGLARPEVVPESSLRQILRNGLRRAPVDNQFAVLHFSPCFIAVPLKGTQNFLCVLRIEDGGSQDAAAEHELVGHIPYLLVGSKVAEQRTQVALIVGGHLPGGAV